MTNSITPQAITALCARGVHFVLCDGKKGKPGWKEKTPLSRILSHVRRRGSLGFIPGRSGLWVLDVDKFLDDGKGTGNLLTSVPALATVTTPRGLHVYFKKASSNPVGNRAWAVGGYSGDIRSDHGYAICWELDKLADALDQLPGAAPTSVALFPKPAKKRTGDEGFVVGNRTDHLNKVVFTGALHGQTDFTEERAAAIESGLPASKVDKAIAKTVSDVAAKTAGTFDCKDAHALEAALEALGITVRYNLRAMRAELSNGGAKWEKTTDRSSADLRRAIADKFSYRRSSGKQEIAPLRFGAESFNEHLNAILYHKETDPFRDWLESLPKWDGTARLVKLLPDCLGAAEGPLTNWAGVYLTLGAVQRTYKPGGLLREIPILIGPQRAGKSQLLSNLLPPDQPEWFSDSVCVSEPTQKRVEGMLGRVIVELSELTGFRRAELESLKAFISRRDDGATRLAYRRDPETALRRCILVGTSNDVECLPNDPSGNSRYVPIQCGEGSHVEPYLDERRVQLWAEGLALYHKGERANLPRSLMVLQAEHGERHRRKDQVIEDSVAAIAGDGPFTIVQLCGLVKPSIISSDRRAVIRLADALRLAGWDKHRQRNELGELKHLWTR